MPSDQPAPLLGVMLRFHRSLRYLEYARWNRSLHREGRAITAMLRVRDEEQFLDAAVRSIADVVDQVVIVDNASTDRTPDVIAALARELANVTTYEYPHQIFRVGQEHVEAMSTVAADEPRKLSTFYNFSLERCRTPYVLKWDGDMVATDLGRDILRTWAGRAELTCRFPGTNITPDRNHRLASSDSLEVTNSPDLPPQGMVGNLAFTVSEPRLFARRPAHYVDGRSWESVVSPLIQGPFAGRVTLDIAQSCYLHLKYCKYDPHSNQSEAYAATIREQVRTGDELSDDERVALRWLAPA